MTNAVDRIADITRELCAIDVAGMKHLIGVRFIDKFKTHSVTSRRDYLSLQDDKMGYYFVDQDDNVFVCNIGEEKQEIDKTELTVVNVYGTK